MIGDHQTSDRCPGALSLHLAADGLLARVRLPGGRVRGDVLAALTRLGEVELTSRANLQLRRVDPGVAEAIAELGLLPSATHERVRNILASPWSRALDPVVATLDAALCAQPELAELSGRFLFALDDSSADVAGQRPDAVAVAAGPGRWWVGPAGVVVGDDEVVDELLAVAQGLLRVGDGAWRLADLPDGGEGLAARLRGGRAVVEPPAPADLPRVGTELDVPAARLTSAAADALAGSGADLRITVHRSVVALGEVALAPLVAAGLVLAPSRWGRVSACTGRPGCAKALADVRADATAAIAAGRSTTEGDPAGLVHWSGCERRCGRPAGAFTDVLATTDGYRTSPVELPAPRAGRDVS
ncbi:MAG: precorrin-3B synthase [Mycobacteriaceae bacterium]